MGARSPSTRMLRFIRWPPRLLYAVGLGRLYGRIVLLLTTTGRKTGLPRVTPLQYEEIDGNMVVASMRGAEADWFRNIMSDSRVEVRVGTRRFRGLAEPVTDPIRVADFIELRLQRHPKMVGAIVRLHGVSLPPNRVDLEAYARNRAMVIIRPEVSSPEGSE